MDTTIDEVSIEIGANSQSASSGLDNLTNSINNLISSLNTGLKGLTNFNSSLSKIKNITSGMNFNTESFSKIQNSLSGMNSIGKTTNLSSVIKELKEIPNITDSLDEKTISSFTSRIKELTSALSPLSTEMVKVSTAFSALPNNITKINTTLSKTQKAVNNSTKKGSFIDNIFSGTSGGILKAGLLIATIQRLGTTIGSFVNQSNDYIENMNFFNVAMGEMTNKAKEFINQYTSVLAVDPSNMMRNMSFFNSIIKGFGLSSDAAYTMSKNLTQLSYDMTSVLKIPVEESMQKIRSGISGELEPMRAIGVALDQASLQETAYALGINQKVSAMTRAQKTELLYYQIMKQTSYMQGDLARTMKSPANALMILKQQFTQLARAIGNIFIPILAQIIPYIQVVVQWLTTLANTIAAAFNFKLEDYVADPSTITSAFDNASTGLEDIGDTAADTNKELDKMLGKFDELNVIDFGDTSTSGTSSGTGVGTGGSLGIPLYDYDALKGATIANLEEVERKLKNILAYVGTIGAGLAAWKIATGVVSFIQFLEKLRGKKFSFGIEILGLTLLLADLDKFRKYLEDFLQNGPTFTNVGGMISEFVGSIADVFLILGKTKLGGALKVVQGVGEIVIAIENISKNGVNWDNATTAIRGLTNIAIGIGAFTGNLKVAGWAAAIQGFTTIIQELAENWEAIKQGDWSGVDKVTLIVSGLEVLGGLAVALNVFSKIKKGKDISKAADSIKEITNVTGNIDGNVGKLSPKLSSLVKNLGVGIVIIGEVAAAAILITGAIIVLGKELEQVGLAWQPVIDNGTTVATGMGIGIGILIAIGTVTALLGQFGGTEIIAPIALGTAILLELGVAAGLFIVEIWAIGEGLNKINEAWQPVLANGGTIATAITLGTTILVAIGVVTAALGVATVASVGLLPLAIGLGTAMLLELGVAAGLFIVEIWAIGEGLNKINEAWQPVLANGETIETAIKLGTEILIAIGVVTAALGVATVASVGLLPLAIDLGTSMLEQLADSFIKFIDNLIKVANQLSNRLYPELNNLNAKLPKLIDNLDKYIKFMEQFAGYTVDFTKSSAVSGFSNAVDTIIGWFTKDPIETFADDVNKTYKQTSELNDKLREANPELKTAIELMKQYFDFLEELERLTGRSNNISLANNMFVNMKEVGKSLVTGFVDGIKSEYSSLSNAIKSVLGDALSTSTARSYGENFGNQLGQSISNSLRRTNFPKFKGAISTIGDAISIKFNAYAEGGFPETGQLFLAREAGPELVGSIGNKAAVANNDQIVEGIAQAAYQGVSQAMKENKGNERQPVNVYIGNKKVYSGYGKYVSSENNMYGTNIIKV